LVHRIYRLLTIKSEIKFLVLAASMTGAWTLYGQCLSLFTFYRTSSSQDDYSRSLSVEWPYLAYGLSLVFLYTTVFVLFSCTKAARRIEKELYVSMKHVADSPGMRHSCAAAADSLNIFFALFFSFLISSGSYGLRGAGTAIDGRLAWWSPIAIIGMSSITLAAPFSFTSSSAKTRSKILSFATIVVTGYISFLSGRRTLLYFVLGVLFSKYILWPRLLREKIRFKPTSLVIILGTVVVMAQLADIFQYLRAIEVVNIRPENIFDIVSDYYSSSDILENNKDKISDNLLSRSLLQINFSGVLSQLSIFHVAFDFRDLSSSFTFSVPSFLISKTDRFSTSDVIGEIMRFSTDYMVSPPLSAFVSFGLIGFLIYPFIQVLFLLLLFVAVSFLLHRSCSPYLLLIAGGYIVQLATRGFPDSTTNTFFRPLIEIVIISIPFVLIDLTFKQRNIRKLPDH
jgi:hypothetical protein